MKSPRGSPKDDDQQEALIREYMGIGISREEATRMAQESLRDARSQTQNMRLIEDTNGMPRPLPNETEEDYIMRLIGHHMQSLGLEYDQASAIVDDIVEESKRKFREEKYEHQIRSLTAKKRSPTTKKRSPSPEKTPELDKVIRFMQEYRYDDKKSKEVLALLKAEKTKKRGTQTKLSNETYLMLQDFLYETLLVDKDRRDKTKNAFTEDDVSNIMDMFSYEENDYDYIIDGGKRKTRKHRKSVCKSVCKSRSWFF